MLSSEQKEYIEQGSDYFLGRLEKALSTIIGAVGTREFDPKFFDFSNKPQLEDYLVLVAEVRQKRNEIQQAKRLEKTKSILDKVVQSAKDDRLLYVLVVPPGYPESETDYLLVETLADGYKQVVSIGVTHFDSIKKFLIVAKEDDYGTWYELAPFVVDLLDKNKTPD